jgi:hypothetical protein
VVNYSLIHSSSIDPMLCKALPGTGTVRALTNRSSLANKNLPMRNRSNLTVRAFTFDTANPSTSPADIADTAFPALKAVTGVSLVSSQQKIKITDLWQPNQPCVFALGRSMG